MSDQPPSVNVARFLSLRAGDQPEETAVLAPCGRRPEGSIEYEKLTFAGLHREAGQVAHGLVERGVGRGTRVLLMVKPGSDLIRCAFALFMVGAVPVVIDPGMGLKNFLQCVRRTRPEVLMGIPPAHWVSRLFPAIFRTVRQRVKVGKAFHTWFGRFSVEPFPVAETGPDDPAAILFTSGSTGPPKGVAYGHGQFDAQVTLIRETFSIEPGEVDLPMLPIFALFNPALGMTTVVPEMNPSKPARVEPGRILQAVNQCGVTNSFGSPVLWKKIAAYMAASGQRLPGLRRILMAGAPVPPALVRKLQPHVPNARIWSPYGATECLPVSAIRGEEILEHGLQRSPCGAGTCVGRPVAGVSLRIIRIREGVLSSMEETEALPTREIGEIIATGPTVTRSYDGLPEATARAKILDEKGDTWHRMGDAGYLDEDGRLWFCGRIAERVVTEAGVLYTDCCEGIFNTVPGVERSALIGLGEAPRQVPAVVIEPGKEHPPTRETVLSAAAGHEMTAAVREVFFCSDFPVDVRHNAKINRLELARRYSGKR